MLWLKLRAACKSSPFSCACPLTERTCAEMPCSAASPAASDTDSEAFSSASALLAVQQCKHSGVTFASLHSSRAMSTFHWTTSPADSG